LIKIIILEENFKWHLEAFASELFIYHMLYSFRRDFHIVSNNAQIDLNMKSNISR